MGIMEKDIPNWIELNGDRSSDHNIVVELIPKDTIPERDVVFYHVPGSNGDLMVNSGTFKNEERTYNIAILNESGDPIEYQKRLIEATDWLLQLDHINGYSKIKDSYSEKFYRRGIFVGPAEITNMFYRAGRGEITFNVRPEKYLDLDCVYRIDLSKSKGNEKFTAPKYFIDPTNTEKPYFSFGSIPIIEFIFSDGFPSQAIMPGEDATFTIVVKGKSKIDETGIALRTDPKYFTFRIDYANPGDDVYIDCETTSTNTTRLKPSEKISSIYVENYPKIEGPKFEINIPPNSTIKKYVKEIVIRPRWYVL